MNVLIISRTPWDEKNSFGNTFLNLFDGMQDVQIYHICCQKGETSGSIAKGTLQLTDSSVLKSVFWHDPATKVVEKQANTVNIRDISDLVRGSKAKRNPILHFVRDTIWRIAPYKRSRILNDFLNNNKYHLLYFPVYSSIYMTDFQITIARSLQIPMVLHISDDEFKENMGKEFGLATRLYQKKAQKKLRELFSLCSYMDVFTDTMKRDYERLFHKPCYVIGKGVRVDDIPLLPKKHNNDCIKIVYTGNLGTGRYKTIAAFGRALGHQTKEGKVIIEIYSKDFIDKRMRKEFNTSDVICIKPPLSAEEVRIVQQNADYLLHVESFSKKAITNTRMSFSTKIIDYMMSGNPIIAIGPSQVSSMSFLKEKKLAVVIEEEEEFDSVVQSIISNKIDRQALFFRVRKFLMYERDISKIQNDMKKRMDALCDPLGR